MIRCNLCGKSPAYWIPNERPRWGSLALCLEHRTELESARAWMRNELDRLRQINFEQMQIPPEKAFRGPDEWD